MTSRSLRPIRHFLAGFRQVQNVLGAAVQLSTLPWLGFVPDDVPSAPPAVGRMARQLGLAVADLASFGKREQTRTDHLREIAEYLSWKPTKAIELKELDEFLLARAMEHDSLSLLFRLRCEYLRSTKGWRRSPPRVPRLSGRLMPGWRTCSLASKCEGWTLCWWSSRSCARPGCTGW
ncbi:DUF4158 domain-containing protein [Streptomyces sp. NPDC014892]|uniref:DUF4158 domain-containing protein n=1 Tax=Streptomyces sp. NPDC014892 TaxID=3364930 RepID=UPI003700C630